MIVVAPLSLGALIWSRPGGAELSGQFDGASPYRYVHRPPGAPEAPRPEEVTARIGVADGVNREGATIVTTEPEPQFLLFVPPGSLATRSPVRVRVQPLGPEDMPPGIRAVGNVYRLRMRTTGTPVRLTGPTTLGLVGMQNAASSGSALIYYRAHRAGWVAQPTRGRATDFVSTPFAGPGSYVVGVEDRDADDPWLAVALVMGAVVGRVGLAVCARRRAVVGPAPRRGKRKGSEGA